MARGRNLLAAALGTAVALLGAEAGVRLVWKDAPAASGARDDLPLQRVADPAVLYRLVPNTAGFFNGTPVAVNSLGLRDRDYSIPAAEGIARVLVLGDSMIFGVGLPPPETLPGHLSRILDPVEAINAGVFGYNLVQETSLLADLAPVYRPDLVVSCFVHNDIENWGLAPEGGAVPEIKSSRFDPPPPDAWSSRLADALLPGTFDPDRLNLLPSGEGAGGLRGFLASHSRLYLFTYLRLRTHSWNMTRGEVREPLVGSPACEARREIWEPLREGFRRQARIARDNGARYMVAILNGQLWQGLPFEELTGVLRDESIPYIDLTPAWGDRQEYARRYTLGWDPHPNGRANHLAAELIADYIARARLLSGEAPATWPEPHAPIAAREELAGKLEAWNAARARALEEDRSTWRRQTADLPGQVDFAEEPSAGYPRVIHGFWRAEGGPAGSRAGRWLSDRGAVLLGVPAGADRLVIEVAPPETEAARRLTPAWMDVTLSLAPGRCGGLRRRLELGTGAGVAAFEMDLPPDLGGRGPLEVQMSVDRPFRAAYLDPGGRGDDARLVSFLVRRIRLVSRQEVP